MTDSIIFIVELPGLITNVTVFGKKKVVCGSLTQESNIEYQCAATHSVIYMSFVF